MRLPPALPLALALAALPAVAPAGLLPAAMAQGPAHGAAGAAWLLDSAAHCPGVQGFGTHRLAVRGAAGAHEADLEGEATCLAYAITVRVAALPLAADGCAREPHLELCLDAAGALGHLRLWNVAVGGWDLLLPARAARLG